jgi:hypothetical protein
VNGETYFPNEWRAAETRNTNAGNARRETTAEIRAATALYVAAADAYDDIANRSRPLVTQERDNASSALQAAIARAGESRQQAVNANGQGYFPDDWRAAEARNQSARNARRNTTEEMKAATALYNAAADAYDEIASKSAPLFAREREEASSALEAAIRRAEQSRQQAVNADAQTHFANDWRAAETRNTNASNARRETIAEMRAATALYNAAADAYDELVRRNTARAAEEAQRARERADADRALQTAIARAQRSRQQAVSANAETHFPDDWRAAEARNTNAANARRETAQEAVAATALYNAAADAYDELVRRNTARVAEEAQRARERADADRALQAAITRAQRSRQQAVSANAETHFPDDWRAAEARNQAAQNAGRETLQEIGAATALYNAAADAYDELVRRNTARVAEEAQRARERADADRALQAAITRAERSRQQAVSVEAATYFPDDWRAAEARNESAVSAKRDTVDEVRAATALYVAAANAYDDLANRSRPLFTRDRNEANTALQAAIRRSEQSRQQAVSVDAATYFPNDWANAEARNQSARSAPRATVEEMKAATVLYVAAADAYDDLANRSRPLFTEERDNASSALQAAIARAGESRQQAMNVNGQGYFPDDWRAAEARNQSARNARRNTTEEMKAATALYVAAADAYDEIASKSAPLFAREREEASSALEAAIRRAEQSRQQAMDADAQTHFPDDWRNAEARNTNAANARRETTQEAVAATALYNAAADAYDEILSKNDERLAEETERARERAEADGALQAAIARAEHSRQQAMEADAQTHFPDDWRNAEARNQTAQDAKTETAQEAVAATALYNAAADAYDEILSKNDVRLVEEYGKELDAALARAQAARQQAIENQGPHYFPNEWQIAENLNQAGMNADRSTPDSIISAIDSLIGAAEMYDTITNNSRLRIAEEAARRLQQQLIDEANNAIAAAQERMNWAEEIGAPRRYAETYQEAQSVFNQALDARSRQDWERARDAALEVISILSIVQIIPDRPSQYLVKTWQSVRDCLWNIAAKPQIYGDPTLWPIIFEANRHQIQDPDLIYPGQILDIPSIAGEFRIGIMEEPDP